MFIRLLDKVLQVKNVYFLFILLYMITIAASPDTTSGRYITEATGNDRLVIVICAVASMCALVGLVISFNPMYFWLLTLPFVFYSFTTAYLLVVNSDPKAFASIIVFTMYVLLALSITWEKINDEVIRK